MSQTTKKAMSTSLRKMLRQKPLSKITVTDIAEDCGVSRMTFYYHFKDIYDLIEWSLKDNAEQILAQCQDTDSSEQLFLAFLHALQDNKPELTNLLRSMRREEVERYLYEMTHKLLEEGLSEQAPHLEAAPEDRAFVLDFYTYASSGILLAWIQKGMTTDPHVLVKQLLSFVTVEDMKNALERLRQNRAKPVS
ncbi:MAG: TetR/AcrR family transcriptional regulator [Oscillospiraceae bacterium]|nr:TetR/AcrR family transcriptional regulator [Oscillospiraceae bacterium]